MITPNSTNESGLKFTVFYECLGTALWILFNLCTLGFPSKYSERLTHFENLVPDGDAWTTEKTFSDRGNPNTSEKTMRQKQQASLEEWDRLNITVSVITATSAAALAIQSMSPNPSHVFWVVTTFYSAAFGMSLQGIIIIAYMTISAGGTSDEMIGRLASGSAFPGQPVRPVAFMMSLPAIITTYSSLALLGGLVTMIMTGSGDNVTTNSKAYIVSSMIPVGGVFICLSFAIVFCEIGTFIEHRARRQAARPQSPSSIPSVSNNNA